MLKDGLDEQLISALRVAARGDALLAPRITRHLIAEGGVALAHHGKGILRIPYELMFFEKRDS